MVLTYKANTEFACFLQQRIPIENGWITKCGSNCHISCNYGFITSGKNVFNCEEGSSVGSYPNPICVKTMAFIIGKLLLAKFFR